MSISRIIDVIKSTRQCTVGHAQSNSAVERLSSQRTGWKDIAYTELLHCTSKMTLPALDVENGLSSGKIDGGALGCLCTSLLQDVFDEELSRLVAGSNERATCDVQEAHILGDLLPLGELFRDHVTIDLHVSLGRAHVLAESDNIHV